MKTPGMDLVIGYGNTLRGDDGVGVLVADALEGWNQAVRTLSVQQLTPELAADIESWLTGASRRR